MIENYTPIKDSYIYQGFGENNYGESDSLFIGKYSGLGTIFRSVMSFDLSALPDDITISSAFLNLYAYRKDIAGTQRISIYKLKKNFSEDTVKWNNITDADVEITQFYGEIMNEGEVSIDITGLVSEWTNTPSGNCGIEIRGVENTNALIGFRSKEYSDCSMHPYLIINYTDSCTTSEDITTGIFEVNTTDVIEIGQRITTTFAVNNMSSEDYESGLGVLQISNQEHSVVNKTWNDEKTMLIAPSEIKVISTHAARRSERIVLVSVKKNVVYGMAGDLINVQDNLKFNIEEGRTDDFNNQTSLEYTLGANPDRIPITTPISVGALGVSRIRIYPKNIDGENHITFDLESIDKIMTAEQLRQVIENGSQVNIDIGANIDLGGIPLVVDRRVIIDGGVSKYDIKGDIIFNSGADNSILQNVDVTGTITIDVGSGGSITLNNVSVNESPAGAGNITIISGGTSSIGSYGVTCPKMIMEGNVRAVVGESAGIPSSIAEVDITAVSQETQAPQFELRDGSHVDDLAVADTAAGTRISAYSGASIGHAVFDGRTDLIASELRTYMDSISVSETAGGSMITLENGAAFSALDVSGAGTVVEVDEGAQVGVIHVRADETEIRGGGAAQIIVDPGVESPKVDGYSQVGSTATVESSMAFSNALSRNDVDTILMGSGNYELLDKHLNINRALTIKANSTPIIYGTITINTDNVILDGLIINAEGTYDLTGYHSAVLINADGNPQNISVINNTIYQDYNGVTVLKACRAVITGNTIRAAEESRFATRGIQIGNTPEIGGTSTEAENINTTLEDNDISGNKYAGMLNEGVGIYIRSSAVASEADAEILGTQLATDNILHTGNEVEYWIANKAAGEFEIWADAEGNQFNAVKSINLAEDIEEMQQSVEYKYSELNLTQYNTLTSDLKHELCKKIFDDRPIEGYANISYVQDIIDGWFEIDTRNLYVKAGYSGEGRGSNPYGSIQDAVTTVDASGTVNVMSGLYEEKITIDKSLILRGPTYNINKNGYAVPADYGWDETVEAVIKDPSPLGQTVIIDNQDNVTIEGLIIEALNRADTGSGYADSHLITVKSNNRVSENINFRNNIIGPNTNVAVQTGANGRMGLDLSTSGSTDTERGIINSSITGNKLMDCKGNGNNLFIWGAYHAYDPNHPYADYSGTVISDNEICGSHRSGIEIAGGVMNLTIIGNNIYNNGGLDTADKDNLKYGNGILLVRGVSDLPSGTDAFHCHNLAIINNRIHDNEKNGIYMGPLNSDYAIENNNIYSNGDMTGYSQWNGIELDFNGDYYAGRPEAAQMNGSSNISANNNNIYDNGNLGTEVAGNPGDPFDINAENNWWGDASGPYNLVSNPSGLGNGVSEHVDFEPWETAPVG
jgi:hypothetical protein